MNRLFDISNFLFSLFLLSGCAAIPQILGIATGIGSGVSGIVQREEMKEEVRAVREAIILSAEKSAYFCFPARTPEYPSAIVCLPVEKGEVEE